jgi:hypothetical protein
MLSERLKILLDRAIDEFYINDYFLIEKKGLERACVSRIAHYLQNLLNTDPMGRDTVVDCEYGKQGDIEITLEKSLSGLPEKPKDASVCPDLVVHHRGKHYRNLLVAEFKGYWNADDKERKYDKAKVAAFTQFQEPKNLFNYKLGAFIELCEDEQTYVFFRKGKEE